MKKLHLSTYISITITLLVIISTLVLSGILYYILSKSLTSEFEGRIKAECGEIMQVLVNQFPQTGNRLTKPGLDDTIRDTMKLGAAQQLQEYFSKNKNSTILVIKENQAWDLMSGESIKGFSALSGKIKKEDLSYCLLNGKKTIVVKKIEMPDLIYISNLDRLDKTKKKY